VHECTFSGAHDDAINIHGTYLRIVDRPADRQVRVRFMHPQTYGFEAFAAGDEIDFVRATSLEAYSTNRVLSAVMLDAHDMLLTLERPAPQDIDAHDVLENVTWNPEVHIRGCTVRRIPTRGFLLSSRRRMVVEGNHFIRTRMEGIHVGADAQKWFESGGVRDMLITQNRFDHCGREAISIRPNVSSPHAVVHRNVRIVGNQFDPQDAVRVVAHNVAGLVTDVAPASQPVSTAQPM
jgi:hypothetical protein